MEDIYELMSAAYDKCEARSVELCKAGEADGEECIAINRARLRISQAADELLDYMSLKKAKSS